MTYPEARARNAKLCEGLEVWCWARKNGKRHRLRRGNIIALAAPKWWRITPMDKRCSDCYPDRDVHTYCGSVADWLRTHHPEAYRETLELANKL